LKNPKTESENHRTRKLRISPAISIRRVFETGTFKFNEIFKGFETLESVLQTFGKDTVNVLKDLRVEVFDRPGFMGVSDEDGHIFASGTYLKEGEEWSIYLDIVHELVHVKQFMECKELFDQKYSYGDRPTEIEAYRVTVEEARRIGMSERRIFDYLEVPWISKAEHIRLAKACGVTPLT